MDGSGLLSTLLIYARTIRQLASNSTAAAFFSISTHRRTDALMSRIIFFLALLRAIPNDLALRALHHLPALETARARPCEWAPTSFARAAACGREVLVLRLQ